MEIQIHNYTRIMTREQKVYIKGKETSVGFQAEFVKMLIFTTIPTLTLGYFIANALGKDLFNPIKDNWDPMLLILFLGIGGGIGTALWKVMIGGYRLIEYLKAYFRPKKTYTNSPLRSEWIFRLTNVHINAVVRSKL